MPRLTDFEDLCAYVVAAALEHRSARRAGAHYPQQTEFDAHDAHGNTSAHDYVARFADAARASPVAFVTALIYMDRLTATCPALFAITSRNVHRMFVAAFVIAVKFLDDVFYSNSFYASLGGMSLSELNHLESCFVRAIKYDCFVSDAQVRDAETTVVQDACDTCLRSVILPELCSAGLSVPIPHLVERSTKTATVESPVGTAIAYTNKKLAIDNDLEDEEDYVAGLLAEISVTAGHQATPRDLSPPPFPLHEETGHAGSPLGASPIWSGVDVSVPPVSLVDIRPLGLLNTHDLPATQASCVQETGESNACAPDEDLYECHAVRMLDIEYGFSVATSPVAF